MEIMEEDIKIFKNNFKYKFDGFNKILNGIEIDPFESEDNNEDILNEIIQDFEDI